MKNCYTCVMIHGISTQLQTHNPALTSSVTHCKSIKSCCTNQDLSSEIFKQDRSAIDISPQISRIHCQLSDGKLLECFVEHNK